MLYLLSELLTDSFPSLRLLRYTTFRTIMAVLTAFAFALIFGRPIINWLFRHRFRDVVRDYSVMDIDSKRGTPTMGGLLILGSMAFSILLWGNFKNPYLYYLLAATAWFAALGAVDDLAKLRYQDSDKGLSRGAKYLLQGTFGLIFGILFLHPATTPLPHPGKVSHCRSHLPKDCRGSCKNNTDCNRGKCSGGKAVCSGGKCVPSACVDPKTGGPLKCGDSEVCVQKCGKFSYCYQPWRYRVSLTEVIPFRPSQLYIPFYKYPLLDLGWLYVLVVVLFIIYASNAVNFADGLDGLAAVPSIFSFAVYGIFAYLFSNVNIARYLFFPYLPGAGEIAVFSGAVVGALMGFLWYNAYPAEVFMGDTGSMALGGALGAIIVLVKQEVLFFLVGGIFLAEILSVMIQDWLGIQVLGRRILFRAPIHHTFQYRGMSEPKIAVRFWITAAILAIISLATVKIR